MNSDELGERPGRSRRRFRYKNGARKQPTGRLPAVALLKGGGSRQRTGAANSIEGRRRSAVAAVRKRSHGARVFKAGTARK